MTDTPDDFDSETSAKDRFTIPVGGIRVTGRAKPAADAKKDKPSN